MAILKAFIEGGPVAWLCGTLALALVAIVAPRLPPLIRAWKGRKDESAPPATKPVSVDDLPSAWLEKMRKEAQHSANNAVAGPILRIDALERRVTELRDMAEEMLPVRVNVARLEASMSFLGKEQVALRDEHRELRREVRDSHERILDALSKIAEERGK